MNSFRKIAAACLIAAFLLPATSFAHKEKKDKKDKGKHKGWYKNPKNPHHPDHVCKHEDKKDVKDDKDDDRPRSIVIGLPKKPTTGPIPKDGPVDTKPGDGKGK